MPDTALRFELLGQRDDVNLIILACTQLMWTALQVRDPDKRVAHLSTYLIEELANSRPKWELITPSGSDRRWGVVRIVAPQEDRSKSLYDWQYDTKGYRIAGSGDDKTFRLCPHIYNTEQDIKLAVRGMNAWRNNYH